MRDNAIKSLIIDDDPFIRDLLKDKLNHYLPEVEIVDTASNGNQGLILIEKYQPDLIFLDVEMTDMTGFEMLSLINVINFKTIFITSYSHYAIKAIHFNALDYLIKPIDLGELKKAIRRYKDNINKTPEDENLKLALHNITTKNVIEHRLVLQTQEGELRLVVKNIIRIEGERNYSYIYLKDERKKLVTKTLADMEDLLDEKGFFRCHKSFLVNFIHIKSSPNKFTLILSDDVEVPISRRRKVDFNLWFNERRNNSIQNY